MTSNFPTVVRPSMATVDGEDMELIAGEALRIPADATRQIRNGDAESRFVLVGASGEE